jgi:3-oxoacyl-[acyl-carrier-protein] synthase II
MEAFINGMSAISPQITFTCEKLLQEVREYDKVRYLKCIEPQYKEFIDAMASRRMSRIIKMGVTSALKCLHDAGIKNPDVIVAGTGLGCIEDTEKFLNIMYTNEEKLLNPTNFIQSTHNTVASTIALMLNCHNYNNTYVHRGFSFESALLDGLMFLQEGSANTVLVGGLDELTTNSFIITDRLNFWKKTSINNLNLLDYKTKGSLAGEGAAFFALNGQKTERSIAKIISLNTFYKPEGFSEIEEKVSTFIQKNAGDADKIDLILMGMNGDLFMDKIYYHLKNSLFNHIPCAYFKHLCGEYDTSSSFALYLASSILKEHNVPAVIRLDNKPINEIRNILIYNHLRNVNHSLILLSSC